MPSLAKFAALSLSTRGTTLLESASDEIRVLHSATVNILVANNRRVGLNKKFSALRRERPKLFAAAVEWLDNPDVQVELTTGGGGGELIYLKLQNAFREIQKGGKPHIAFGFNKPGKPRGRVFSATENLAAISLYLDLCVSPERSKTWSRETMIGSVYANILFLGDRVKREKRKILKLQSMSGAKIKNGGGCVAEIIERAVAAAAKLSINLPPKQKLETN